MIYISKGVVCKGSTEQRLTVARGGLEFVLTKTEAVIWLGGQFRFAETTEAWALHHLNRMGLVEYAYESAPASKYRILSRCVCCAAKDSKLHFGRTDLERTVMVWLTKAGLRLSAAELIFLMDHGIVPEEGLLYRENRQALTEIIYTRDTIFDNELETQMETAEKRDEVIRTLEKLIRRKQVVLL